MRVIVRCPECGKTSPVIQQYVRGDSYAADGIFFACFACGRVARTLDNLAEGRNQ